MMKKLIDWYSRLTKRDKIALGIAAAVILVVMIDQLIVGRVYHQMRQLDTHTRDQETAIKKSLHVLLRKDQISAEIKQYANYSVKAKSTEEEMTVFLKDLETLAGQASVSLLYVKPGASKPAKESETRKYIATLECEGRMEEIVGFFYRIETFPGFLKIEKYAIEPKNKEATVARCGMTVSKTILS